MISNRRKKLIMGIAAILILVFHFWMPITTGIVEASIYKSAYIGVDLFFLMSGYSLGRKKEIERKSFLINRVKKVYIPFVMLTIICAIYKGWTTARFVKVISGIEFFTKGGGAFLWFLIAIMIVYVLATILIPMKNKYKWKTFIFTMILWISIVIVLQFVFSYTKIFILLNRLPIFMIGMYWEDFPDILPKKYKITCIAIGLIIGGYLLYSYGGVVRLSKPIVDIYYIIAIPFVVSIACGLNYLDVKSKIIEFIGGFTLEIYGLQMIFGYDIERAVYGFKFQKTVTFLITSFCIIVLGWLFFKIELGIKAFVESIKINKEGKK